MIRTPKFDGDASRVIVVLNGAKKECTRVMQVVGGKVYQVWELIVGYIFTTNGSAIQTKDGSFIRTKDQA